jgi:PAP2 superfamily
VTGGLTTFLASGGRRALASLTPKGWRHLALQVGLLGSFEVLYALSGIYGRSHTDLAVANARGLLRAEETLGLAWEHGVQNWTLRQPHVFIDLANRLYFSSQFAISIVFLFWVYARRTSKFARVRNALLGANFVSLIVLFVYPVAPPRMVPGSGFVDTLDANAVSLHSHLIVILNNPNSAVPSLHASYALVLAVAGFTLVRSRPLKLVWALYPLLVFYSVVATANHFVLDLAAGAAALLATPVVDRVAASGLHRRLRARGSLAWATPERERAS